MPKETKRRDEGGSAAPTHFSKARASWDEFKREHPNLISRDLYLANSLYYAFLKVDWEKHPGLFDAACSLVDSISESTDYSISHIVGTMEEMASSRKTKEPDSWARTV